MFTDLKDLPNYFFALNKEINKININNTDIEAPKKNDNYITFSDYNKNLFSTFIETDGAYINDKIKYLTANLKNINHPFKIKKLLSFLKKMKNMY